MKKTYEVPRLMIHGPVAELTARFGNNDQSDAIFFAGQQVGSGRGSIDYCATANGRSCI